MYYCKATFFCKRFIYANYASQYLGEEERAMPIDKSAEETLALTFTPKSATKKDLPAPFMVGKGLPPVLTKLVAKI